MTANVADLFFDVNGTYLACSPAGHKIPEESRDIPQWVVDVVAEKFARGVVSADTVVHIPYGIGKKASEILALKGGA